MREEIDTVRPAVPAQLDAVVHQPLGVETPGGTGLAERVDGGLLKDSGALALLDVRAVLAFQDHAVDACAVQQTGEQETCRSAADDPDGCVHGLEPLVWIRPDQRAGSGAYSCGAED